MKRGFTLVEILIASSVLGLGVLGIATLFAGAAQQQKLAADQTDSLRVAGNIDALVAGRFARFAGVALDDNPSLTDAYLASGQWHAVASSPTGGAAGGRLDGALLFDLLDDGVQNQTAFGLADVGTFILYRAPWVDTDNVPPEAWSTPSNTLGEQGEPYTVSRLQNLAVGDAVLQVLPYGRLQPGFDVVVTFEREALSSSIGGVYELGGPSAQQTLTFSYRNWLDVTEFQAIPDFWPRPHMSPGPLITIAPAGEIDLISPEEAALGAVDQPGGGSAGDSYFTFRVQRPGTTDPPYAWLDSCRINLPNNTSEGERWLVREIRLENLEYRDDRLLSLNDRLAYTEDTAFPGGRRPSRGVAMLYRRSPQGQDQLMSLSYTLEPLGRVSFDPNTELPLVLPDTFDRYADTTEMPGAYGLMSQVELEVGFDVATQRYTVTAPADGSSDWAVQKGQLLVVGAKDSPVNATIAARGGADDPGADAAVRVTTTRRDGMQLVGVLDDSPRSGFNSLLSLLETPEPMWFWALRDIIVSEPGGDESVEWRVRPTGAQVITFGGGL